MTFWKWSGVRKERFIVTERVTSPSLHLITVRDRVFKILHVKTLETIDSAHNKPYIL